MPVLGSWLAFSRPKLVVNVPSAETRLLISKRGKGWIFRGVMTRSIVVTLSELYSPCLKGGNSSFIAATEVVSETLFPFSLYRFV